MLTFNTGADLSQESLPTLVLLAGIEGGGQDLFEKFFSFLPVNVTMQLFEPALHLTADDNQRMTVDGVHGSQLRDCPQMPYARSANDFGEQAAARLGAIPVTADVKVYVRARDGFPMGRIRTPLARPDLIHLMLFHGILYKLKVLVVVRNATEAVHWSVRHKFHNSDVGLQVRLIEDSFIYLDAAVRLLPCGSYAIIDVDSVAKGIKGSFPSKLHSFLDIPGISETDVDTALQSARTVWLQPPGEANIEFGHSSMESFFSIRALMWPLLSASKGVTFFSPALPSHWPK